MKNSIEICNRVANMSTDFEKNTSDLKRIYLINNIMLYNNVVANVDGFHGSFGTGYPFYALKKDLSGKLPIINEQIRYNNDLIKAVEKTSYTAWHCSQCLEQNGSIMPDLKQICKTCPNMDNDLKPRKILNRLPDIDMWMVCEQSCIDSAKEKLTILFDEYNMHTSDINPIQTIEDISEITEDLRIGNMPEKLLPIDAHIIDYSTFYSLIEKVPSTLSQALEEQKIPYLPIHPLSYRKTWQYDDVAYNFIYDYLSALTEFNFDDDLKQILLETRRIVANNYSFEQLYNYLIASAQDSNKRRFKTLALKDRFKERVESWKK